MKENEKCVRESHGETNQMLATDWLLNFISTTGSILLFCRTQNFEDYRSSSSFSSYYLML